MAVFAVHIALSVVLLSQEAVIASQKMHIPRIVAMTLMPVTTFFGWPSEMIFGVFANSLVWAIGIGLIVPRIMASRWNEK